ncbi:hypothetical protein TCA2_4513 [Paenibacillus sp. TCA20]|uniref:hypothetical protein n=1 Tax=Paenibacillus sp. TCA20 TaxID=1499968 RepID=UPI0004D935BB|nr:hypothetical protein [Paenibacillus sp. TCA20]GAK42021.1 hypothetical protein TCA2_4513 [Paenibacillus sp. TCA20]
MKPYVWKEGMSLEETKDGAYWERNMLALLLANYINTSNQEMWGLMANTTCGWYYDTDNNWEGWLRVISINSGAITFHIPDSFDVGTLPEIKPNWDGHSTEEKWKNVMKTCGVIPEGE